MVKRVLDMKMAADHLTAADARLVVIIESIGNCEIKLRKDLFQALVQSIIYQQLAEAAADALYTRFVKIYGLFPRPSQLLTTKEARLRAAGL